MLGKEGRPKEQQSKIQTCTLVTPRIPKNVYYIQVQVDSGLRNQSDMASSHVNPSPNCCCKPDKIAVTTSGGIATSLSMCNHSGVSSRPLCPTAGLVGTLLFRLLLLLAALLRNKCPRSVSFALLCSAWLPVARSLPLDAGLAAPVAATPALAVRRCIPRQGLHSKSLWYCLERQSIPSSRLVSPPQRK